MIERKRPVPLLSAFTSPEEINVEKVNCTVAPWIAQEKPEAVPLVDLTSPDTERSNWSKVIVGSWMVSSFSPPKATPTAGPTLEIDACINRVSSRKTRAALTESKSEGFAKKNPYVSKFEFDPSTVPSMIIRDPSSILAKEKKKIDEKIAKKKLNIFIKIKKQ